MGALGCLLPLGRLLCGAGIGGAMGGGTDAAWGGAIGAAAGLALMVLGLRWYQETRSNWPPE